MELGLTPSADDESGLGGWTVSARLVALDVIEMNFNPIQEETRNENTENYVSRARKNSRAGLDSARACVRHHLTRRLTDARRSY